MHKLNVVLVTDVADSPAVELHVSVRCTAGKSASEPVKSTPPTAEAPAPVAESQVRIYVLLLFFFLVFFS